MLKMGMPEGAVVQKMAVEGVSQKIQDAVLAGGEDAAPEATSHGGLSAEEEEIADRFRKMLKMGMPEGAVVQKMAVEGVSQKIQDAVLAEVEHVAPETSSPGADAYSPEGLTAEEEEIANRFRKMLKMGMPAGAVQQKMAVDGVSQKIQDAVLAGGNSANEEAKTSPYALHEEGNASPNQMEDYEDEEIIDELEEEIVDEGEEFEEEILEEYIDDVDMLEEEVKDTNGDFVPQAQSTTGERALESTEEPYYNGEEMVEEHSDSDGYVSTNSPGKRSDIENQLQGQAQQPRTAVVQSSNQSLVETPEKPLRSPSSCWYWITCLGLLALLGTGAGVGYWLTTDDEGDAPKIEPGDPSTDAPTAAPTVSVSTTFEPVQGDCNFDGISNVNPIDQCDCYGEIRDIPDDVRNRYRYNRENFISLYYEDFDDDISSCIARNQALVWVSSGDDASFDTDERTERYALATIFASTSGSQWSNRRNWLSYGDVCLWSGVECNSLGVVTALGLSGINAAGMLPGEIALLKHLETLTASQNQISGPLPVALFTIPALEEVDVSFNLLTGVIPPTLSDAQFLKSLNVENNLMSGRLTSGIGNAQNLESLNINSNQYEGELPSGLFQLSQLSDLDIGDNRFFGTISSAISKLISLNRLTLGPNLFTGTIQSTIASLSNLAYLSIQGIDITGRLPASFGYQLMNLTELIITGTSIEGNIDTSFGTLPNLSTLDLSSNKLRGAIPSELGNLQNLVTLSLNNNFFDGQIPESLGDITTLFELRLNNNLLQNGIPLSFSNLSSLGVLRLESNRLQDRVANEICGLRQEELFEFVVDCPLDVNGETFGIVCEIPECCTRCTPLG